MARGLLPGQRRGLTRERTKVLLSALARRFAPWHSGASRIREEKMRYKIKAPDKASYENLKAALQSRIQIKVDLPHRLMMSIDDPSDEEKELIKSYGASLTEAIKFGIG